MLSGAKYQVGPDAKQSRGQGRQLKVQSPDEAVLDNNRYSRGIKNFQPSPQVSSIDYLMGQWVPGPLIGQYDWKGLDHNPMQRQHDYRSIGADAVYY